MSLKVVSEILQGAGVVEGTADLVFCIKIGAWVPRLGIYQTFQGEKGTARGPIGP